MIRLIKESRRGSLSAHRMKIIEDMPRDMGIHETTDIVAVVQHFLDETCGERGIRWEGIIRGIVSTIASDENRVAFAAGYLSRYEMDERNKREKMLNE